MPPITESAVRRAIDLLQQHRLGRGRAADTLLVATLLEAGVLDLASCNPSDFQIFDEISVVDPCDNVSTGPAGAI